jgi:hypothetical protein
VRWDRYGGSAAGGHCDTHMRLSLEMIAALATLGLIQVVEGSKFGWPRLGVL